MHIETFLLIAVLASSLGCLLFYILTLKLRSRAGCGDCGGEMSALSDVCLDDTRGAQQCKSTADTHTEHEPKT